MAIDRGTLNTLTGEGEAHYRGHTLRYNSEGWISILKGDTFVDEVANLVIAESVIDGRMSEALRAAVVEVLRANLFDGEAGGIVHMGVDDLLDEAADILVTDGRFVLDETRVDA